MRKIVPFLRSRAPVLLALAVLLGGLAIGYHETHNYPKAWQVFRFPYVDPDFADMRAVTHHIDCLVKGRDPYIDGSCSPWHYAYNYPPIWLELRYLGVRSTTTNLLSCLLAGMFFATCLVLFRARNWITGTAIFLALLSWPVLLALERGNTDIVIFSMLTLGALWIERSGERFVSLKQGLLIAAMTILKIYPMVAVVGMIRNRKAVGKAMVAGVIAVVALLVTSGSRLPQIFHNTPQISYLSFGSLPAYETFAQLFGHGGGSPRLRVLFAISLAAAGVLFGLRSRRMMAKMLPVLNLDSARGFMAAAGLAIYVFVFFFGASFEYRLIFLLCAFQCLIEELNRRITAHYLIAVGILLLFLWSPRIDKRIVFDSLDTGIFILSCAWLTDTLVRALGSLSGSAMKEDLKPLSSVSM